MDYRTLRDSIPALEETVYLNTGATGPSPQPVIDAAANAIEAHEREAPANEGVYQSAFEVYDQTRSRVAEYLNTEPETIALTQSTSDSIGRLATAMPWSPGDRIARTDTEHPAGILPWQRLQESVDLTVDTIPTNEGYVDRDAYIDAVADAQFVCLSSICWLTGAKRNIPDLAAIAHDHDTRILVDAVQSIGQHPIDLTEWDVDYLAASGHKWLLGHWGAGILYIDQSSLPELRPAQPGFRGLEDPYAADYQFHSEARRFESGTESPVPYAALREAIDINTRLGAETIQSRIAELTDYLRSQIPDRLLVSPSTPDSGLVTIQDPEPQETVERLKQANIRLRSLPHPEAIRVSVHAFNTRSDINQLLDMLSHRM